MITYPVAYFLAKHVRENRQLLFLLILLIPFWVGEIVRTYAIMILLGNNGAVNLVLEMARPDRAADPFMYTSFSLGIGIIYLTSLYMLLPLYSALEKIPNTYLEAAADLGAGSWTRFWRVTLPLSRRRHRLRLHSGVPDLDGLLRHARCCWAAPAPRSSPRQSPASSMSPATSGRWAPPSPRSC